MKILRLHHLLLTTTAVGLLVTCVRAAPPSGSNSSYQIVRLTPPVANLASAIADDLNGSGNVVGDYRTADGATGAYFYRASSRQFTLLGPALQASGINAQDVIVGVDDVLHCGLYWSSPTATPTPLLPLAQHTHATARMINQARVVVGSSYIPEDTPEHPDYRAIVAWKVSSSGSVLGRVVLPFPDGDLRGTALDINEAVNGVTIVVGTTGDATTFPLHAVQWAVQEDEFGQLTLLSGPTIIASNFSGANSLNDASTVVGSTVFSTGGSAWPFYKLSDGAVIALAGISKATHGSANGINNSGKIVGYQGYISRAQGAVQRAVLWNSPTSVVDLNTKVSLGSSESLRFATHVNDRGDILAVNNSGVPCLLIAK